MNQTLVHIGLDESGALAATTPFFTMAAVVAVRPEALRRLVKRAALQSGKHLKRRRTATGEFKGQNQRRLGQTVAARQGTLGTQDKIKTGHQADLLRWLGESG